MSETTDRAARPPNIFTVPPGRPFLEALAEAILAGDLPAADGPRPDPLDLPAMTILLPTRRATRALQEAFLRASAGPRDAAAGDPADCGRRRGSGADRELCAPPSRVTTTDAIAPAVDATRAAIGADAARHGMV